LPPVTKRKSRIPAIIGIWALIALAVSLSPLPQRLSLPAPQILIAALTILFLLVLIVSEGMRQWVMARDLYGLTLFHLWRLIPGIVFLQLHQRQLLPRLFAVPAGWGDIIVAVTAPLAAALLLRHRWPLLLWHVLAMAELVNVVAIATGIGLGRPTGLEPLRHFPLSLLPLYLS
jgi:hypothetical protein